MLILRHFRQWLACRRLNKLVAKQRSSFDCESFRRRRAAGKKGWAMRQAAALPCFASSPSARSRPEAAAAIARSGR